MENMTEVMISFPGEVFSRTEEILKTDPLAAVRYSHRLFAAMRKNLAHNNFWSSQYCIRGEVFEKVGFGERSALYVDTTYAERWHALVKCKGFRQVITNTGTVYFFDLVS